MIGHVIEPELIEIRELEQLRAWQDFDLSSMPHLISSMHLCHAVFALWETGLLDRLQSGMRTVEELVEGFDATITGQFLRYLVQREVLMEHSGGYSLTRRGELLTSDVPLARLGLYLQAYGPVVSRMHELLDKRAVYGVDVARDGGALGVHAATLFSAFHTPVILEATQGRDVRTLLDIGCGGGSLLVDACVREPGLAGIGLDLSPEAVQTADALADDHGVSDRVRFHVADAFDPGTWPAESFDADGMCAVSVLHEHFRHGEQAVVDILDRYAAAFPGLKVLLVGEPELRYDAKENDDDFFLVHILTGQGLPRAKADWLPVFERSRWRCERIYSRPGAGPRMRFYDLAPRGN
jgi:SAM-dependent methyltransferase